jgi:DNA excision repair protein ERCC-4
LKVTVDVHEPAYLRDKLKLLGCTVEVRALEAGDYMTDRCCFERKSIQDFVLSIRGFAGRVGGRIFDQMQKLVDFCERTNRVPFLMIVGDLAELKQQVRPFGDVNVNAVFGAVASIVVRYGVNVVTTLGEDEFLYVMLKIAEKVDEGKLGLPHRPSWRELHPDRKVAHVANVLGCGPTVAKRLLERFGCLRNVLLAKEEDLLSVPGIGPVTVARLKSLLE